MRGALHGPARTGAGRPKRARVRRGSRACRVARQVLREAKEKAAMERALEQAKGAEERARERKEARDEREVSPLYLPCISPISPLYLPRRRVTSARCSPGA